MADDPRTTKKTATAVTASATTTKYNIPTSNKYDSLSDEDTDNESEMETTSKVKIPPIVVASETQNFNPLKNSIQKLCANETYYNYSSTKVTILAKTLADHNKIIDMLKKQNTPFHTYAMKSEKQKHIVIRGLPPKYEEIIVQELQHAKVPATKCTMIQRKDGVYMAPTYILVLKPEVKLNELTSIRYINSTRIYWSKYKTNKRVTQCYRCQEFGHGQTSCFLKPNCVKCAAHHLTNECKKNQEDTPKCTNCGGDHPANYSGCSYYKKHLDKVQKQRDNRSHPSKTVTNHSTHSITTNVTKQSTNTTAPQQSSSYANIVTNTNIVPVTAQMNTEQLNDFQTLVKEIKKLDEICNIKNMIKAIRTLQTNMPNAKDELEKLQAFINFTTNP